MEVSAGRWWWWGNLWKKLLHTGQRQVYVRFFITCAKMMSTSIVCPAV